MKLQLAATFCVSNLIWNEDNGKIQTVVFMNKEKILGEGDQRELGIDTYEYLCKLCVLALTLCDCALVVLRCSVLPLKKKKKEPN